MSVGCVRQAHPGLLLLCALLHDDAETGPARPYASSCSVGEGGAAPRAAARMGGRAAARTALGVVWVL